MNSFKYSAVGLKMTESFEGVRQEAYQDVAGVWTIGYGHTGPSIHAGMFITEAEAEALLESDLAAAETFVNRIVTSQLNQNEFDALVDFTFNEGRGHLLESSLLKEINAGNFTLADTEFAPWDEAGGRVCGPLEQRRIAEAKLFAEPV